MTAILERMYVLGYADAWVAVVEEDEVGFEVSEEAQASIAGLPKVPAERARRAYELMERASGECEEVVESLDALSSASPEIRCELFSRSLVWSFKECACAFDPDFVLAGFVSTLGPLAGVEPLRFAPQGSPVVVDPKAEWGETSSLFLGAGGPWKPYW